MFARSLLVCAVLFGCSSSSPVEPAGKDAGQDATAGTGGSGAGGGGGTATGGAATGGTATGGAGGSSGAAGSGGAAGAGDGIHAGAVTTLLANSGAGDDLSLHPGGYLVASDPIGAGTSSSPSGTRLLRIELNGSVSTLTAGLRKPIGNAIGPDGSLYACEWGDPLGSVFKVDPQGDVSEIATDISYPSNLVLRPDGSVWVSAWGTNQVLELRDGVAPVEVAKLSGPVGMELDGSGGVLVASANNGTVWRLDDLGEATVLGKVPGVGSVLAADLTPAYGGVYVTSYAGNRIWRVANGEATLFAGTGVAGGDDGAAAQATFRRPNGIAASPDGRTLYVQEFGGALRVIPIQGD